MPQLIYFFGILVGFSPLAAAYTAANCPSTIPEWNRVDCYPESGSNEQGCISKGCMWCETNQQGPPWCFHDTPTATSDPSEVCSSCSCGNKVDCFPDAGSSESGCYSRGCLWCPSNVPNEPWCIVGEGSATTTAPPSSGGCPTVRYDCYPEAGSSEQGCYSRGCAWCPSSIQGEPWCVVQEGGTLPPTNPPTSGCATNIPEAERIDCWPGGGASQAGCVDAGCIWCASNQNNVPWCFFNTTNLPEGIPDEDRVNCIPEGGFSPNTCTERGCSFANVESPNAPMCYFQNDKYGYLMVGDPVETSNGYRVMLERIQGGTLFGNDVDTLTLDVTYDTSARLHIKFYDGANERFEVPLDIKGADSSSPSNPLYEIQFFNDPSFYFKVIRRSTGTVLLDTSLGGLTFSNQFLQIATRLPSKTMYGFGEQEHQALAHDFNWETFGMYARDQPPDPGANLYGVHPFYISIEEDFNSHGVLFLNSNAQDVQLTPAPGVVYRTIGGVLDMYVFVGPEPNSVIEQYTTAIGTTFMPPYWSLGFQLCRYGYGSLDTVQETVSRMDAYDIPLDVQYGDIDYMDEQRDFTYDHVKYAGLPDYVKQLQAGGKHYVVILDPCLTEDDPAGSYPPYDEGASMNVYVTESDGVTPLSGKVWPPGNSVFPDYTNPDTATWWTNQCKSFHDVITFDGLWIDMNEPANFVTGSTQGCANNDLNNPPYKPKIWGDTLADKSVCPDARHKLGNHYDVHNLYGWSQSNVTMQSAIASTGKRPFVISRSTFPGSGQWAAHWLGDNNADWHDLKMSVIGMLEFNLFGIPYVGADICGFNGDSNEELCERWMELGSFYPFSRNHNGIGYREQDPAVWGDQFANNARNVLRIRYTLLPYLYTLFYQAHVTGRGVVLPLSFEFTQDTNTHKIDEQFMWGPGIMISPVLYQGITSVTSYFPDARWYDYSSSIELTTRSSTATVQAPRGTIPMHIRGGYVIPSQEPAANTVASRKNPFGLTIALDDNNSAYGELYWDGGDTLDPIESGQYALFKFNVQNSKLTTTLEGNQGVTSGMTMGSLRILGILSSPTSVRVNNNSVPFTYTNKVVTVSSMSTTLNSSFSVEW